jgi:hypothetical protein
MDDLTRADIIKTSWGIHRMVEERLLGHPATGGTDDWLDKLRNNLHAVLTISDQFLPHAGLKQATATIYGGE